MVVVTLTFSAAREAVEALQPALDAAFADPGLRVRYLCPNPPDGWDVVLGARDLDAAHALRRGALVAALEATPGVADVRVRCVDVGDLGAAATFDRPLIILTAPRAGSTMFYDLLRQAQGVWNFRGESKPVINTIPGLHPAQRGFDSMALTAADATPAVAEAVRAGFYGRLVDRDGRALLDVPPAERPAALRLIEKTPQNALRVPFLRAIFPDARFVHLFRDPAQSINSLIEGWEASARTGTFVTVNPLPGWSRGAWCFLLPPGWRAYDQRSLAEVAAFQWQASNAAILDALDALPPTSRCVVEYADLLGDPASYARRVCAFADLGYDARLDRAARQTLPLSKTTVSPPSADEWRGRAGVIEPLLPALDGLLARLRAAAATHGPPAV